MFHHSQILESPLTQYWHFLDCLKSLVWGGQLAGTVVGAAVVQHSLTIVVVDVVVENQAAVVALSGIYNVIIIIVYSCLMTGIYCKG